MNKQATKSEIPAANRTASEGDKTVIHLEGDKKVIRLNGCTLHEVFRNGQWICMVAE